jgi:energy-coupling factor transporter ATP-binding protein EcfA2
VNTAFKCQNAALSLIILKEYTIKAMPKMWQICYAGILASPLHDTPWRMSLIRAHISEITFSSGLKISLQNNSILIVLGPNNSGKSATLNDIKVLMSGQNGPAISLSNLSIHRESPIEDIIALIGPHDERGVHSGPNFSFYKYELVKWWDSTERAVGPFLTKQLISDLDTRARLSDCDSVASLDFRVRLSANHPFHHMYRDPALEEKTSTDLAPVQRLP